MGSGMPRRARTQVTVELAPVTKQALEEIVRRGESLSVQDFVRRAVDEKLDRWKTAGHRLPEGQSPADLVEEVRARRAAEAPARK